jgi:hypothetical protein
MKRISLSLAAVLLLAACSSQQTVNYKLTFTNVDKSQEPLLTTTSMEVIDRRLGHLGVQKLKSSINSTNIDQPILSVTLPDKQSADALTSELTEPFTLSVMTETTGTEKPDITIDGQGGFKNAGITEKDFEWVDSGKDPASSKGEVRLTLTPDGKTKIQTLFHEMKGKSIGIFVRDKLVSLLTVETDQIPDALIIRDVPSPDIAQIFADDMDVGLHVTFTPVP